MIRRIKKAIKHMIRLGGHPAILRIPPESDVDIIGSSKYNPETNTFCGLKVIIDDSLPECVARIEQDGEQ